MRPTAHGLGVEKNGGRLHCAVGEAVFDIRRRTDGKVMVAVQRQEVAAGSLDGCDPEPAVAFDSLVYLKARSESVGDVASADNRAKTSFRNQFGQKFAGAAMV